MLVWLIQVHGWRKFIQLLPARLYGAFGVGENAGLRDMGRPNRERCTVSYVSFYQSRMDANALTGEVQRVYRA